MADESNPANFSTPQNFKTPPADQYPQTKTVLDMYSMTQRTITISTAHQQVIPSGQPGGRDLFHE